MKYIVWILIIAALAVGGYYYWQKKQQAAPKTETHEGMKQEEQGAIKEEKKEETKQTQTTSPASGTLPSPGEGGKVSVQEISMTAGNFSFNPKEITLKKGRPVKITIQNSGHHTFTIDELGVNKSLADGANVVEFTPQTEGVFIYYCATPGHRVLGQYGTVTVEE